MRWWSSLFPASPSCWFCQRTITYQPFADSWAKVCKSCTVLLSPITGPTCLVCGRPVSDKESDCLDCQLIDQSKRVQNVSVVSYTEKSKNILARYKYHGDERYAVFLGALMGEVASSHRFASTPTLVSYVPLHPTRLKERGFNQARLLAEQIGNRLGLPTKTTLERIKPTPAQASLSRTARLQSLIGAFQLIPEMRQLDLATYKILLVDDVYTTGTTIRECAWILREAGVESIYAITFAR